MIALLAGSIPERRDEIVRLVGLHVSGFEVLPDARSIPA